MVNAVDLKVPVGTPVSASADGVVTDVIRAKDGELGVEVFHPSTKEITYYGHLSESNVHKGEQVKRGQQIARSGDSGNTRGLGPHLHYEVDRSNARGDYSTVPFKWSADSVPLIDVEPVKS
jgi:murein DD-endopeptidase MepM/ murein hydrolase activator NlpD